MFELKNIFSCYSQLEVLHGVSMKIEEGLIVTLLGANGAGKTTLLRCISGVQSVSAGSIELDGLEITKMAAHKRVESGCAHSPEGRQIFTNLTVEENLKLGAYIHDDRNISEDIERNYSYFPILKQKRHQIAGELSGGQQQMLAISRALMSRPRYLLLDEPSMGLAPIIVSQIMATITQLKAAGITVLLVEQNAFAALSIADYAYVMETGEITLSGPAEKIKHDDRIKQAYLGL